MHNPFAHFWLFTYAVWDHAFTLLAGCVVTVVINFIEKYGLKGKKMPLKVDIAALCLFVFFACFQAWRDQYLKALNAPSTPPIVVNVPPISVPPAQIVIMPGSQIKVHEPSALTGFAELGVVKILPSALTSGSPISANVGFIVEGAQPIHGFYFLPSMMTVNFQRTPDVELEKRSEALITSAFNGQVAKYQDDVKNSQIPPLSLGVGNSITYRTVDTAPLTDSEIKGIACGQTRVYLMAWAIWKDSNNRDGVVNVCQWMQAPQSVDLSSQEIVWHLCTWSSPKN